MNYNGLCDALQEQLSHVTDALHVFADGDNQEDAAGCNMYGLSSHSERQTLVHLYIVLNLTITFDVLHAIHICV